MYRRKLRLALFLASLGAAVAGAWAMAAISVGTNVNITREAGSQAEGTIAIDPTNTQRLFAANNPPGALFFRSTDAGSTWTSTTVPGSHCCDNVADFDTFGNLFLTNLPSGAGSIPVFLSTDGGASFALQATLDTGSVDQPSLDAGAGAVWVTWNDGSIKASGAAVTGLGAIGAFGAEQAAPGAAAVTGQFGDIAIGPGGQVVVTYQSGAGNNPGNIYVNTDADGLGAGGFGAQVTVTSTNVGKFDSITPQDSRTIDAEANLGYDRSGGTNDGRLYMAYTDETPDESNNTEIFVRFSDDDGATWSPAVRVNDDVGVTAQFNPAISVDQTTGNVAVTWHDARNDAVNNNNTEYWGAVSEDGGATFGPNFRISAGVSNEDVAGSSTDYGDYTWNDFHAGMLFPIWADNSNSTGDNPAGANSTFDMYTAKITVSGAPATLTLSPQTDTNKAGEEHCVTATVTDAGGNPTPNVTVRFSVSGANSASGSATTDANGQAQFCYTGTVAGTDTIAAYADTNNNNVQDPGEPSDTATKTYTPAEPATLTLAPETATNTVDSQHCVTATVKDQFGNPTPGITVRFTVTGPGNTSGSAVTDSNGQATFCYTSALPGTDTISAFADTDNDGTQDAGEPSDTATKQWVLPASTAGCKVNNGGWIIAANGDKATFGGNSQVPSGGPKGQEQYTDHGPAQPMKVKSINVQAVTCSADRTQASIFGQATINDSGTFDYRIDVEDLGESGRNDTYRIRLSNGYDSGKQTLEGGNVQIQT